MPGNQGLECPDGNRWIINPTNRGFTCLGGNHTLNQLGEATGSYTTELATEKAFLQLKYKNEQHRPMIPENAIKKRDRVSAQQKTEAEQEEVRRKAFGIAEMTAGVRTVAELLSNQGSNAEVQKLIERRKDFISLGDMQPDLESDSEEEERESSVDEEEVKRGNTWLKKVWRGVKIALKVSKSPNLTTLPATFGRREVFRWVEGVRYYNKELEFVTDARPREEGERVPWEI